MSGPGEYVPDVTEGITRVEDLPNPRIEQRSRNSLARRCPRCGRRAGRYAVASRTLHDLGDPRSDCPLDLVVPSSTHRCRHCSCHFSAGLPDLALPQCLDTRRVQRRPVRLVAEGGLPEQAARWHRGRDHRVFVPYATLPNGVEAAGGKKGRDHLDGLPRPSAG